LWCKVRWASSGFVGPKSPDEFTILDLRFTILAYGDSAVGHPPTPGFRLRRILARRAGATGHPATFATMKYHDLPRIPMNSHEVRFSINRLWIIAYIKSCGGGTVGIFAVMRWFASSFVAIRQRVAGVGGKIKKCARPHGPPGAKLQASNPAVTGQASKIQSRKAGSKQQTSNANPSNQSSALRVVRAAMAISHRWTQIHTDGKTDQAPHPAPLLVGRGEGEYIMSWVVRVVTASFCRSLQFQKRPMKTKKLNQIKPN
jgi:hypothetical protein